MSNALHISKRLGRRTMTEATYVFLPQQVAHLKLTTWQGSPVDRVKPDLVVMPSEADLLEANDPSPGRTAQLDDAVPELVLEVLSKTTADAGPGRQAAPVRNPGGGRKLGLPLGREALAGLAPGTADVPAGGRGL